ncbi:MAG: hypothetical protein E7291_06855 [Lachnospiraceae bacterium]|nr:hypothetical protein [Lachnospiraceae bacterium]
MDSAHEMAMVMERVAVTENPGTSVAAAGWQHSFRVMWNKNTVKRAPSQTIVDYACEELGAIPKSLAYEDYYWVMDYDSITGELYEIFFVESISSMNPKYVLYPDGSDYIKGNN